MALCALLSSSFLFSAITGAGCGAKKDNGTGSVAELWSTYSTTKVSMDPDTNGRYTLSDAVLNVSMMKNETEGAQLIITANKDIGSFSLKGGELKSADGEVFPLANVDIYQQKYIRVNTKSDINGVYQTGEYVPDMLLPMTVAENYKENTVKAGNNQGLYVEFDSTGVKDGIYTGNFVLDIDGDETDVPVTVNVWDIEYSGRRSFKSCFVMYQSSLLRGEFDNSDEMVNKYIDFFLDYKINTCLHNKRRNDFNAYGEEWLEQVKRTKDNLNYNSVYIPYQFQPSYVAYSGGKPTSATEICLQYVTALAKISTPEDCYIDYAYFYPFEIDEADIDTVYNRASNAERMLAEGGEVDQMLALAVERLKADAEFVALGEKYGEDFTNHVLDSVLKIPTLFTNVGFIEEWVENYNASFCPYLSVFGTGYASDRYASASKERGTEVWAYTCVGPTYPYPTFHIDDYNLGTRISGWMEKCYGIDGYLYWATTNGHSNKEWYKYIDQYEDSTRYNGADGDGYLVYPGKYYGIDGPIPSLRLVAYRDSMDDYDMLCVYEELLEKYYEKYNLGTLNFNDYVNDLYAELFGSAIYYVDDSLVVKAREELAKRILALQNEDEIMLCETFENGKAKATVYANAQTAEINGKSVTGVATDGGYKYELTETGGKVTVKTSNSQATFSITGSKATDVSSDKVSASDLSTVQSADGVINATLKGKLFGTGLNDIQTTSFTPNVTIKLENVSGVVSYAFTLENLSVKGVDLFVRFVADGRVYELGSCYLGAGEKRDLRFNLTAKASEKSSGTLQIYMQNIRKNEYGDYDIQSDKTLKISALRAEYKKGE